MVNRTMLRVLKSIMQGNKTAKEIMGDIGITQRACYLSLQLLESEDFIEKMKVIRHRVFKLSNASHAQSLKKLFFARRSIDFSTLIDRNRGRILMYILYSPKSIESIVSVLKIDEKTVYRILRSFMDRWIVKKEGAGYVFDRQWSDLFEFMDDYRMYSAVDGNVLWRFEDEIIFQSVKQDGIPTGLSAYKNYGVKVLRSIHTYYLPKRKLSVEEVFVHGLLEIEEDPRLTGIAIAFYLKNKLSKKRLFELAMKFDVTDKLEDVIIITKGKLETKRLPRTSRNELEKILRLYGVR